MGKMNNTIMINNLENTVKALKAIVTNHQGYIDAFKVQANLNGEVKGLSKRVNYLEDVYNARIIARISIMVGHYYQTINGQRVFISGKSSDNLKWIGCCIEGYGMENNTLLTSMWSLAGINKDPGLTLVADLTEE